MAVINYGNYFEVNFLHIEFIIILRNSTF